MPIYEYECEKCGRVDEVIQKFSDKPLKKCRYCSGKVHKLISQSSFHLKGTGWYVTDYAKKSGASSPPAKSKNTEKKESKSSAPATSKSEK